MTCPACGATLRSIPGQALAPRAVRPATVASWGTAKLHPVLLAVSLISFAVAIVGGWGDISMLSLIPCGGTALYLHLRRGRHGGNGKGAYGYVVWTRVDGESIAKDPVLSPRQRLVFTETTSALTLYLGLTVCLMLPGTVWTVWSKSDAGLIASGGAFVGVAAAWWRAGQRDDDVDTPAFRPVT